MTTESNTEFPRAPVERRVMRDLTTGQQKLKDKHGLPDEFAKACYLAVPAFISMDEANKAIEAYNQEWIDA